MHDSAAFTKTQGVVDDMWCQHAAHAYRRVLSLHVPLVPWHACEAGVALLCKIVYMGGGVWDVKA